MPRSTLHRAPIKDPNRRPQREYRPKPQYHTSQRQPSSSISDAASQPSNHSPSIPRSPQKPSQQTQLGFYDKLEGSVTPPFDPCPSHTPRRYRINGPILQTTPRPDLRTPVLYLAIKHCGTGPNKSIARLTLTNDSMQCQRIYDVHIRHEAKDLETLETNWRATGIRAEDLTEAFGAVSLAQARHAVFGLVKGAVLVVYGAEGQLKGLRIPERDLRAGLLLRGLWDLQKEFRPRVGDEGKEDVRSLRRVVQEYADAGFANGFIGRVCGCSFEDSKALQHLFHLLRVGDEVKQG